MAHSSGGGSSCGGCHFSGGSSSGGADSRQYHRYSRHSFKDGDRYSYLDKNGTKKYIYCTHHPAENHSIPWILYVLLIIFVGLIFRDPSSHFFVPKKILNPASQIVIEDRQDLIQNKEALIKTLTAFYEETGITPAVETVSQEQWQEDHYSFQDYAMERYHALFEDEMHWLIVYSREPETEHQYEKWRFEGIIGDNTGSSVNDSMCRYFTKHTYQYLKKTEDPGEAIGLAFQKLQYRRSRRPLSYNVEAVLSCLLFGSACVWPVVRETTGFIRNIKYKNAVLDEYWEAP